MPTIPRKERLAQVLRQAEGQRGVHDQRRAGPSHSLGASRRGALSEEPSDALEPSTPSLPSRPFSLFAGITLSAKVAVLQDFRDSRDWQFFADAAQMRPRTRRAGARRRGTDAQEPWLEGHR